MDGSVIVFAAADAAGRSGEVVASAERRGVVDDEGKAEVAPAPGGTLAAQALKAATPTTMTVASASARRTAAVCDISTSILQHFALGFAPFSLEASAPALAPNRLASPIV